MFHEFQVQADTKTQILVNMIRWIGSPAKKSSQSQFTYQVCNTIFLHSWYVGDSWALIIFAFNWLPRVTKLDLVFIFVSILRHFASQRLIERILVLDFLRRIEWLNVILLELFQWLFLTNIVLGKVLLNLFV